MYTDKIIYLFTAGTAIGRLNLFKEKVFVMVYFKEICGDKEDEKILHQDHPPADFYGRNLNVLFIEQSKFSEIEKTLEEHQAFHFKFSTIDNKCQFTVGIPNNRKIFPVCPFTLDDLQFRRYLNDFAMVLTSYHELEKAECFKPVRFFSNLIDTI